MRRFRFSECTRLAMLPLALGSAGIDDCGAQNPKPPPPTLDLVVRRWWFTQFPDGAVGEDPVGADRVQVGGVAKETHEFGGLILQPPGVEPKAFGEVYSNESGATYWVSSQAPHSS